MNLTKRNLVIICGAVIIMTAVAIIAAAVFAKPKHTRGYTIIEGIDVKSKYIQSNDYLYSDETMEKFMNIDINKAIEIAEFYFGEDINKKVDGDYRVYYNAEKKLYFILGDVKNKDLVMRIIINKINGAIVDMCYIK